VSEQPEIPSDAVPEVKPTEHVAPETPQPAPEPIPEIAPASEPAAKASTPLLRQSTKIVQKPQRHTLVTVVSAIRALVLTFAAAVTASTIFMYFTTPEFLSPQTRQVLGPVRATAERNEITPTAIPTPFWFKRVGIVAGHSGIATYGTTKGNVDSGAVCPDGFTEATVTLKVAQLVVAKLQGKGYDALLLDEFDLRLDNLQAAAFVSLHANPCDNYNDGFNHSGFSSTYPLERETVRDQDIRLNECVRNNYSALTGLPFNSGSITENMTNYHAFHAVGAHPGIALTTPGIILELGLLGYDRDILQNHTDKLAQGVVNGLLCFLEPQPQPTLGQSSAPIPTPTGIS